MQYYNWDGSKRQLEKQVIVPIITPEEMHSSILEVVGKLKEDAEYRILFNKTFGDHEITPERIYQSIAQYEYTLISANSKYDQVKQKKAVFTAQERYGYTVFNTHCASCHSGELFTDQTFRNIGFPINRDSNEAGRARVTGDLNDYMIFAFLLCAILNTQLLNGSFGQFKTLREVLDYMDQGCPFLVLI